MCGPGSWALPERVSPRPASPFPGEGRRRRRRSTERGSVGQQSRGATIHHSPLLAWTSSTGPSCPSQGHPPAGLPGPGQGQAGSSGPSAGSQSTASSGALSQARSWRGSWLRGTGALPLPLAEASFSKGHSLPSATRLRKRTSREERGQAVSDWGFRTGAHGNRSEKGCSA